MRYMDSLRADSDRLSRRERLERLDRTPGAIIRFGVEAILRLVPGIGDAAASALSCRLLYEAYQLGVPHSLLARMIANVLVDEAAGAVPVAAICSTSARTAAIRGCCESISSSVQAQSAHRLELVMSQPLVVLIPHRLGKPEALRRLKAGLARARQDLSSFLAVQGEAWTDDQLQFRVSALGQVASGTIDVEDDHVQLEVTLPWLLALLADKIQPAIRAQGRLMLEKK